MEEASLAIASIVPSVEVTEAYAALSVKLSPVMGSHRACTLASDRGYTACQDSYRCWRPDTAPLINAWEGFAGRCHARFRGHDGN